MGIVKQYKEHRVIRVLIKILLVIGLIAAAIFLFLKLNPVFGGSPSKEERLDYAARSVNFADKKFYYPKEYELDGLSEDNRVSVKGTKPSSELPVLKPSFAEEPEIEEVYITWLGHSSILIQMHGMKLLIDPVFSQKASPVAFAGPSRFSDVPISVKELPGIDVVLLSHDHYDHLDMKTIMELNAKTTCFVVPLGVENHLERWGVERDKIYNMAWWEEIEINGLTIGCTPARHYSSRSFLDAGNTLFASWVLKDEYHQLYESGDTGFGGHFEAIHEKYGDFDLVLMDCAQYDMKWHPIHMLPEESVNASAILGAKLAMPIHWGAYVLSTHGWDDPPERFVTAAEAQGLPVVSPRLGETLQLSAYENYQERWWREFE